MMRIHVCETGPMKFMLLIYIDPHLLQTLPASEYDTLMRGCLRHADALQAAGTLVMSQRLQPPTSAQTLRRRDELTRIIDGPFANRKVWDNLNIRNNNATAQQIAQRALAGFNLIEAADADEAMRIAQQFPWAAYGSIEVRPVDDLDAERVRLGA